MPQFLPFERLHRQRAILVDGKHPHCLCLSHWRGVDTPLAWRADTSAEIVLKALAGGLPVDSYPWVTANHYDIDALVGVWAILNPDLALAHAELLRRVAELGDFRATEGPWALWEQALAIVCWLDAEEAQFYAPFAEGNEARACLAKFEYFLPRFEAILREGPPKGSKRKPAPWQLRQAEVLADLELLRDAEQCHIRRFPELGILWMELPRPLDYYALFAPDRQMDTVVTVYPEQRYEVEHRYTTWVQLASRPTTPRVSLQGLAAELQAYERAEGCLWQGDRLTETGPMCYLLPQGQGPRSAAERFASPKSRSIQPSSLSPADFETLVLSYFEAKINRL